MENNKYTNGKIYKIVSPSHPELVYYGSTIEKLSARMGKHRNSNNQNKNLTTSKQVLQYDDAIILLVENYSCNNREELNRKEGEYILNNQCCNKAVAGRTQKEWHEDNKEANKEKRKQYYENNKHKLVESQKAYQTKHKEQIKEKRETQRDCPKCGKTLRKYSINKHLKTCEIKTL